MMFLMAGSRPGRSANWLCASLLETIIRYSGRSFSRYLGCWSSSLTTSVGYYLRYCLNASVRLPYGCRINNSGSPSMLLLFFSIYSINLVILSISCGLHNISIISSFISGLLISLMTCCRQSSASCSGPAIKTLLRFSMRATLAYLQCRHSTRHSNILENS